MLKLASAKAETDMPVLWNVNTQHQQKSYVAKCKHKTSKSCCRHMWFVWGLVYPSAFMHLHSSSAFMHHHQMHHHLHSSMLETVQTFFWHSIPLSQTNTLRTLHKAANRKLCTRVLTQITCLGRQSSGTCTSWIHTHTHTHVQFLFDAGWIFEVDRVLVKTHHALHDNVHILRRASNKTWRCQLQVSAIA